MCFMEQEDGSYSDDTGFMVLMELIEKLFCYICRKVYNIFLSIVMIAIILMN